MTNRVKASRALRYDNYRSVIDAPILHRLQSDHTSGDGSGNPCFASFQRNSRPPPNHTGSIVRLGPIVASTAFAPPARKHEAWLWISGTEPDVTWPSARVAA
jgi:hypothetical protein